MFRFEQKVFSQVLKLSLMLFTVSTISACGSGGGSSATNPDSSAGTPESEQFISNFSTHESMKDDTEQSCVLDDFDELLLQAINNARSSPQVCGDQAMQPVKPVQWSCKLQKASTGHSDDMAANNFFAHQGSDGLRVKHRVSETDYEWSSVGENIAAGYPGIDLVMQAWIDSPSHCSTLMNEQFEDVAVSLSFPESGDYEIYWTMVLASEY